MGTCCGLEKLVFISKPGERSLQKPMNPRGRLIECRGYDSEDHKIALLKKLKRDEKVFSNTQATIDARSWHMQIKRGKVN